MDIFVRNLDGKSVVVKVQPFDTVLNLKETIHINEGLDPDNQLLFFNGTRLEDWILLCDYGIEKDSAVDLSSVLKGGKFGDKFAFNHKDLNLIKLAEKYRIEKMICRKCYARLPIGATNCRKRKCGHSSDLRMKTRPEENDRKKS